MRKKLVDRLKLALGRQLSPEQMANAKEESEGFTIITCPEQSMKIDELGRYSSGEFLRFRQRWTHMTIPNAPGWEHLHTGYYPSKTIEELYDSKGRIKEKTISSLIYNWERSITRIFDPLGRLIGKRKRE